MNPLLLVKLWLAIKPLKRLRERREAKRAKKEQTAVAAGGEFQLEEDAPMSEIMKSVARSALKIGGTALATYAVAHGMVDTDQVDGLNVALESIIGGVVAIAGLVWSHKTHKAS